ncbi:SulP family inorganic anion transporter [Aureispira anguillae]|uniref:SulP family inorganic anion transporter n=1 Tax=Aureispira anguillae TaxID=2864201 RepID=A0A915YLI0_9BACT|nr:SulP family inorganic anion transporter [Aureispira anguillae]BDS15214.1 SulP family inorganic anion transporter [Aureispira anguillae]
MKSTTDLSPFHNFKDDFPASIVVFLVAMPLCLGVALASGAPLYSGLISGIVGGIVVGSLSGSPLGVSGPAAGLAVIVLNAITDLGSFDVFLVAVVLAGILQIVMGYARAGIIAYYFPSSVVHGMLAGIGVLIFMKQIPHAVGYDVDPEGDFSFIQADGQNTLSELVNMLNYVSPSVVIVSVFSLAVLILWELPSIKQFKFAKLIQGPLVVVILGICLNLFFGNTPDYAIKAEHLVNIPISTSVDGFLSNFAFPDFSALSNPQVYVVAIVLAVVGSLETLLCAEASDKQDPLKRITPANRELKAQGVGNMVCGLIGGIPVTQVIVRSSVNQQSGGKTKASAVFHGILLLLSIIIIPRVLNLIPLATLAAILMVVGYKLAKPTLFKKMYAQGWSQFIPFVTTIVGIVFTNLLMGIALGMAVAIFIILRNNFKISYHMEQSSEGDQKVIRLILSEDVTFLNKASILKTLSNIPDNVILEIDASNTYFIHNDVMEIIEDFEVNAKTRNITVRTNDLYPTKEHKTFKHYDLAPVDVD